MMIAHSRIVHPSAYEGHGLLGSLNPLQACCQVVRVHDCTTGPAQRQFLSIASVALPLKARFPNWSIVYSTRFDVCNGLPVCSSQRKCSLLLTLESFNLSLPQIWHLNKTAALQREVDDLKQQLYLRAREFNEYEVSALPRS